MRLCEWGARGRGAWEYGTALRSAACGGRWQVAAGGVAGCVRWVTTSLCLWSEFDDISTGAAPCLVVSPVEDPLMTMCVCAPCLPPAPRLPIVAATATSCLPRQGHMEHSSRPTPIHVSRPGPEAPSRWRWARSDTSGATAYFALGAADGILNFGDQCAVSWVPSLGDNPAAELMFRCGGLAGARRAGEKGGGGARFAGSELRGHNTCGTERSAGGFSGAHYSCATYPGRTLISIRCERGDAALWARRHRLSWAWFRCREGRGSTGALAGAA